MSLEPLLRAFFVHTNSQWCLNFQKPPLFGGLYHEAPVLYCSYHSDFKFMSIPLMWVWCLSLASHMREKKWWEKCGCCCCAGEVGNWCEGWVASQGDSCGWSQGHGSLPCHSWQVLWSIILFFILDRLNFSYSYLDGWKSFEHEPSHGRSCIYPIDLVVVLICLKIWIFLYIMLPIGACKRHLASWN